MKTTSVRRVYSRDAVTLAGESAAFPPRCCHLLLRLHVRIWPRSGSNGLGICVFDESCFPAATPASGPQSTDFPLETLDDEPRGQALAAGGPHREGPAVLIAVMVELQAEHRPVGPAIMVSNGCSYPPQFHLLQRFEEIFAKLVPAVERHEPIYCASTEESRRIRAPGLRFTNRIRGRPQASASARSRRLPAPLLRAALSKFGAFGFVMLRNASHRVTLGVSRKCGLGNYNPPREPF